MSAVFAAIKPGGAAQSGWRYGLCLVATLLGVLVTLALSRTIGDLAPLTLLALPPMVSAWYGGLGPGLLSTAISALSGSYFLLAPLNSFRIDAAEDWVRLGMLVLIGIVVSALCEALHRARLKAELESARLRALLEHIPAGVALAEAPSGRVVLGNSRVEKILGHPMIETPDLASYPEWPALHPDGRRLEAHEYPLARALQGEVLEEQELLYERGDGSRVWLRASAAPVREADGRLAGAVVLFFDMTDRKNLEESLRQRTAELRETGRRKDEFLATLAHELRNPLAPIYNSLQILTLRGNDPAVVARTREVMERQVRQMIRLVDDLLDVTRISQGKLELRKEPLDLAGVVSTAVEISRPLIEARRHDLTVAMPEQPLRVEADAARVAQVLSNLLNNAAKYTEPGGRIELTAERRDGHAVLRVRDNGAGIAPEMLPRIFDLFAQVEGTLDRAQGGLGIGLTLVRRLVEMHGGAVEAHSGGLSQGSEIVVRLPALA
ncbi:MAG TPA: ATP-binding protein [Thermoanaerobaculia bacterium]